MKLPNLPADRKIAEQGGELSRAFWTFFDSIIKALRQAVYGGPNLTTVGAIPKVSEAGVLAESAITDDGTGVVVTERGVTVRKAIRPTVLLDDTGAAKVRLTKNIAADARGDWLVNLSFDGVDFNLDDVTKPGLRLLLHESIGFRATYYPAGPNPVTGTAVHTLLVNNTGVADIPGVYKVSGTQVVGAQQADPGTAAGSPTISTSITLQTADGVYSSNEQTMLNDHKTSILALNTAVFALKAEVDHLITDRDRVRAVLQAHGLMA